MLRRFRQTLPILAVLGAITVVVYISVAMRVRRTALTDTGETRPVAEATLAGLQAMHPASIDDADFRRAVERAPQERYVTGVWLFTPDGRTVYSSGVVASRGTVEDWATTDTLRVLDALPERALSAEQRTMLLAASAIRAEGTHNDVLRHLLRPIETPDGSVVALIGAAYDVSEWVAAPGMVWIIGVLGGLAGFLLYWLSLPLWVFLDARERGERAWPWATFVFMGNLVAFIAYLVSRSPVKARSTNG